MSKLQLILLFTVIIILSVFLMRESFTSPGTMVQLATSHVPTAEDYNYYRNIYPKVIRRDLIDMTGDDPGPIQVPLPQLYL